MMGQGVERMPRAAYPLPSTPPTGAATPLPPHIQGAERQMERRARHTASRWALRVLVVGGLVGAAWLLTGAAAQAADRVGEPEGSLLGPVVNGDAAAPVTGLLMAAAQPLETVPAHQHKHDVVADILEVPQRVLTRPVVTVREVVHGHSGTIVDAAAGGVDLVLREVVGPLRLTGGPAATTQRFTAVADTVTRHARPAAERPQQPAVAPVQAAPLDVPVAPASRVRISKALRAPLAALRGGAAFGHVKADPAPSAHRHTTALRAAAVPVTVREGTPGGDGPAPGQLHLGDVSGTPTSGSGTPTEGGSAAFLPAAIANSTMACQRLPIASDVEARRYDAEAPTVSPD